MRVVLVTPFYPGHGGGVERVAAQLAVRMAAAGHDLTWCASDTDAPPALPGVRCEPMRCFNGVEQLSGMPYPLWGTGSLFNLARLVREADAVHVHDCIYAGNLVAAWLARRHKRRLLVTQHIGEKPLPLPLHTLLRMAYRLGTRTVLRPAHGVAFVSRAGLRYFEALAGPQPNFHHVPNGVDSVLFAPRPGDPAAARKALGFDPAKPLMLFVGRFVPTKRLPLLRQMAAARPEWQWCVVGDGPEQPGDWGLPNLRVLPSMDQPSLADHYRAADLLVLPSHGEGFPLVVQEAMACGLPTCMTAAVAAGSRVPDDLWLELPEQPDRIGQLGGDVIAQWLAQGPEWKQAQREACARFARDAWSWEACARAHTNWLLGPG